MTPDPSARDAELAALTAVEKRELLARILRERASGNYTHPLSLGQKALYLMYLTAPESPVYNMAFAVRIRAPGDAAAFRKACQGLLTRHPCLRSRFTLQNGQPVQQIDARQEVHFEHRALPNADLEEIRTLLREASEQPFDLERGPLFRALAVSRSEADHVLLLCVHHTVCDGWSFWLLMDELRVLYASALIGAAASLPPPSASYADYVLWQSTMLSGEEGERLWAYWKKQLGGVLPVLDLPTDRPRPPALTFRGSSHSLRISTELFHRLQTLARESGVTLFMTVLATFQVLLYRYTGQTDFLVGSPTAGRPRPEFASVVGYFINPVALRADLAGDPPFRELLRRVQRVVGEALAHQDYPFPLLVQQLHPARDPSRSPLFQVLFNWQKPNPLFGGNGAPSTIELFDIPGREGQFDLSFEVGETSDGLLCTFRYMTDLFDGSTIARMGEHFLELLKAAVAAPHAPVSALPLMSSTEKRKVLVEWNNTAAPYRTDLCIHQLFEAQAERTPTARAIRHEDAELSYAELNGRANQLAHHLRNLGVGPETIAGICLDRSIEMVVGVLAVLKAGGAYLPLDPGSPRDRIELLLQDARPHVVLTTQRFTEALPSGPVRTLCLDLEGSRISRHGSENPRSDVGPENLAYAIYTSGSTGVPKAVLIEHRQIVNYTLAGLERLQLAKLARFAQVQPLTFDSSLTMLFSALCSGGQLHVISRERSMDAQALGAYLQHHEIQCLKITPSHLAALQAADTSESLLPSECLIIGGEPSNFTWFQRLRPSSGTLRLINHYGPTETTVGALVYLLDDDPPPRQAAITPLGRPLPNVQVYVLDRQLRPCPAGVPGELYIGGAGVARGYLNRPDLTAQRFIPDQFSRLPGARLYRTGDMARYLPDGIIEFLGRIDTQVKLRGIRVELEEIEAVLTQHPSVQKAAVVLREDRPGHQRLVAYVVPRQLDVTTPLALRQYLQAKVPVYMVPAAFVFIDALPLTSGGKLNRGALPVPSDASTSARFSEPPRGRTQRLIAMLWKEALQIETVSIDDNFFDVGGHSLLLISIHAQLQADLGRTIPLVDLFTYPTVRSLASHLDGTPDETDPLTKVSTRAQTRRAATASVDDQRALRRALRRKDADPIHESVRPYPLPIDEAVAHAAGPNQNEPKAGDGGHP